MKPQDTLYDRIFRPTYSQLLRGEAWMRRRRDFLATHGSFCDSCGKRDGEERIEVHHKFYDRARAISDYGDHELTALCESCHREVHKAIDYFRATFAGCCNSNELAAIVIELARALKSQGSTRLLLALSRIT